MLLGLVRLTVGTVRLLGRPSALRAVALPVGLGLVWMLTVQNLPAAIAALLQELGAAGVARSNANFLAAALGAAGDTPGVGATVGGG
ncbi:MULTISPECIES: hypothetical protein [unclassified Micromonospora]|uniref:hypothetical protein n=1 Tax=unclassified Micromonospora TaxID=2617518 RepID=UPI002FF144E8